MSEQEILLPSLMCLEDHGGNWNQFINAIYETFRNDFVISKPVFRGKRLGLKRYPIFQDKEYTFYHMTHTGDVEHDRTPDLRRCERICWAKPVIEKGDKWSLKIWPQIRKGKNRICIWIEFDEEPDYIVILDDRKDFILPWTAFTLNHSHEKRKKNKEYEAYLTARAAQS